MVANFINNIEMCLIRRNSIVKSRPFMTKTHKLDDSAQQTCSFGLPTTKTNFINTFREYKVPYSFQQRTRGETVNELLATVRDMKSGDRYRS